MRRIPTILKYELNVGTNCYLRDGSNFFDKLSLLKIDLVGGYLNFWINSEPKDLNK